MPKDVEIEQKQRAHSAKGLQTILPERINVHGSETEIRGSECKKHGSECGNRHIRSHDPLSRSEKSPLINFSH